MLALKMQLSKGGRMQMAQVLHPFVSLASSVLLGIISGVALSAFVGWRASLWAPISPFARRLPSYISQRYTTVLAKILLNNDPVAVHI